MRAPLYAIALDLSIGIVAEDLTEDPAMKRGNIHLVKLIWQFTTETTSWSIDEYNVVARAVTRITQRDHATIIDARVNDPVTFGISRFLFCLSPPARPPPSDHH
jgi:hypothetical protein